MKFEVHHHFHADERVVGLLTELLEKQAQLNRKADLIMNTQADAAKTLGDVATKLDAIATGVGKISGETTTLVQEVAALTAAAGNEPISDELQAAISAVSTRTDSVAAAVKAVDDLVPDAPAPAAGA